MGSTVHEALGESLIFHDIREKGFATHVTTYAWAEFCAEGKNRKRKTQTPSYAGSGEAGAAAQRLYHPHPRYARNVKDVGLI